MRLATILAGLALTGLAGLAIGGSGRAAEPPPLVLESKIALGSVAGRIDHFALDASHGRLFVAEQGNDSVAVVDLKEGRVAHRLSSLREPHGIAYHAATGTLYVANARDGSVRLYQGPDFAPAGTIPLGDDADNILLDPRRDRVVIGYSRGALAVIDPAIRQKVGEIFLWGHPESFLFDHSGARLFVNIPEATQIAIVDVARGEQTSILDMGGAHSNFPMAFDADRHRLMIAFRNPARLSVFDTDSGKREADIDTCRDADDVSIDGRRQRIYVSCGEGNIDVFDTKERFARIARLPTVSGASTSLFVPGLAAPGTDRLYLGVHATRTEPATVWVFRPQP